MNSQQSPDTDALLDKASSGDASAADQLLDRYRSRLRWMVAVRMDSRLAKRVDASDVVQEALLEAHRLLPGYLDERPLPFYPWLRKIAWNRLVDLHRRHVQVRKRSVTREDARDVGLSDRSAEGLAQQLFAADTSPTGRMRRAELHHAVQSALVKLPEPLREVLLMRHLEQLPVREIAALQGVAEGTVKSRHFRALTLLRTYLEEQSP